MRVLRMEWLKKLPLWLPPRHRNLNRLLGERLVVIIRMIIQRNSGFAQGDVQLEMRRGVLGVSTTRALRCVSLVFVLPGPFSSFFVC